MERKLKIPVFFLPIKENKSKIIDIGNLVLFPLLQLRVKKCSRWASNYKTPFIPPSPPMPLMERCSLLLDSFFLLIGVTEDSGTPRTETWHSGPSHYIIQRKKKKAAKRETESGKEKTGGIMLT